MNKYTNKNNKLKLAIHKIKSFIDKYIYLEAAIYTIVLTLIHQSIVHDESVRNLNKLIAMFLTPGIIFGVIIAAPFSSNLHSINGNMVTVGVLTWVYIVILFILKNFKKHRDKSKITNKSETQI